MRIYAPSLLAAARRFVPFRNPENPQLMAFPAAVRVLTELCEQIFVFGGTAISTVHNLPNMHGTL